MEWGLRHITAKELTAWAAYEQEFGPLGQARDDQLTALLALVIANGLGGLGGAKVGFKYEDFLPNWSRRARAKKIAEVKTTKIVRRHPNMAKWERMAAAMGWTEE